MKVLVCDGHADDGEVSAGGTIARLVREGHEVWSVYFCTCNEDPININHIEEHKRACEILGIKKVIEYNYPRNSYLELHKQEIRDELYKIRELYQPNLVLCPSIHDFHQDHVAISECSQTIFRDTSTILGFEVIRSVTPDFKPNLYVILNRKDFNKKMWAIECYMSQLLGRPYFFKLERFIAHMNFRGTQAKTEWAESFEVLWGRL